MNMHSQQQQQQPSSQQQQQQQPSSQQQQPPLSENPLEEILNILAQHFVTKKVGTSVQEVLTAVEEAQWFYNDVCRIENPSLPKLTLGEFTEKMMQSTSELRTIHQTLVLSGGSYEALMRRFDAYKRSLPRCGAVILNQDLSKVLLVKEIMGGWGFPKGKLKEGEEDHVVAVREVFEEIGFNISPFIAQDEFIERFSKGTRRKLFVVPYISESTPFVPMVRNEIRDIKWHHLDDLNQIRGRIATGVAAQYFAILPFLQPLMSWISKHKNPTPYEHINSATANSDFAWPCTIKGTLLYEPFNGVGHYIDGPVIIEHISNQNVLSLSGVISREEMLNKLSTIGDVFTRSVICIEPVNEVDFVGYSNCYSRLKNVMQGVGVIFVNQQNPLKIANPLGNDTLPPSSSEKIKEVNNNNNNNNNNNTTPFTHTQNLEKETTSSESTTNTPISNNINANSNSNTPNINNEKSEHEKENEQDGKTNNITPVKPSPSCVIEGMYLVPLDVNAFSSSSFIRTHAYDTFIRTKKIGTDDSVKRERLLLVVIMKWG